MPKVTFLVSGASFECAPGARFLDVCQENDAPHDFGCTVGSCGTCCLTLERGADQVDPPSADELETVEMRTAVKGARLGCQLVIRGDIAVKPVD